MNRTVKPYFRRFFTCALLGGLVACVSGCAAPHNPWIYASPPTTVEPRSAAARTEHREVVVLGVFEDPSRAPHYSSGVGKCMSDALGRALMHEGGFDVWINPQLSRSVEHVILLPTLQHEAALRVIAEENPGVRYVITGKVTDFYHTADLPAGASRWGLLGRRNEAIVAIDMRIVDLKFRRVVGADHLKGTAGVGSTQSDELYSGVALDSYVFWSTPLGRASKSAIERAVRRTEDVVPSGNLGVARITARPSQQELTITGGTHAGLAAGREYYIVTHRPGSTHGTAVYDPITDQPVKVRITSASRTAAHGLLIGRPPLELEIRGALLRTMLPTIATPAKSRPFEVERPIGLTAVEP